MNTIPEQAGGLPEVNQISGKMIANALFRGIGDFRSAPLFGLFFGGVYAFGGLFILYALSVLGQRWMIFPVAIGFPLIGPFIAAGLYEVSRQLEGGQRPTWKNILTVIFRQQRRELGWMAFITLFIFWMWMYQIRLLLAIFLGKTTFSTVPAFVTTVTTTPEGFAFLIVGSIVGLILSLVLFSVTVMAMPMLLDRDIDFITAMITSVKAVLENPVPMLAWGVIITILALVGMSSMFIALIIILPVLGHTAWHLYRAAIQPV